MKFSIVLPTYNRSSLLEETLRSLINQDFDKSEYEIIIIDDNSSDNTENLVDELINKNIDSKIVYFKNKSNKGIGFNRNFGIELAKGEYVIQTEDDAKYPGKYLKSINEEIVKKSNGNWGTMIVNPRKTRNFEEGFVPKLVDFRRRSIDILTKKGKRDIIGGWIYKKDLAKNVGGYKPLKIGEDTEFVQRIKNKGYKIIAIFSTYWLHQEPNTFIKFYNRMFKQGYAYKEYKEEFSPKITLFSKLFWLSLIIFPVVCIMLSFVSLCFIVVLLFGYIMLTILNPEIRGMYPLIWKSKYKYLMFFVLPYYLCEIYGILFGRIKRSIKEKEFLIY